MRNPITWLIAQFAQAENKLADAVTNTSQSRRFVCGTPNVWAEEQRLTAAWAIADHDPRYGLCEGGKFYGREEARGVIAQWQKARRNLSAAGILR